METKFIPITEKIALKAALERGEKQAVTTVMDEISRLESVIMDYEIGIIQINEKFKSKLFKSPKSSNTSK